MANMKFWGEEEVEEHVSEGETEEGSDSEEEEKKPVQRRAWDIWDANSGSGQRKPMKSAEDKFFGEMKDLWKKILEFIDVLDFTSAKDAYENIQKVKAKAKKVIVKKGIPKFYFAGLILTRNKLTEVDEKRNKDEEFKKKINKRESRALFSMLQSIGIAKKGGEIDEYKKQLDEVEKNLEEYRTALFAESEGEEEKVDVDEKESSGPIRYAASGRRIRGRAFWTKAYTEAHGKEESSEESAQEESSAEQDSEEDSEEEEVVEEEKVLTPESLDETLLKMRKNLGRKGFDSTRQARRLEPYLQQIQDNISQFGTLRLMSVLIQLMRCYLDYKSAFQYIRTNIWLKAQRHFVKFLDLAEGHSEIVVRESDAVQPILGPEAEEDTKPFININIFAFLEKLDLEFTKSMQHTDPHTKSYLDRLKNEKLIMQMAKRLMKWYTKRNNMAKVAACAHMIMNHTYYKVYADYSLVLEAQAKKIDEEEEEPEDSAVDKQAGEDSESKVDEDSQTKQSKLSNAVVSDKSAKLSRLANVIYEHGADRLKAQAILFSIYHHALMDNFFKARDMLLMSHLQENVHDMDINTQVLYNRTVVQIGLCAFRKGLIRDAHACLSEIYSGGRVKELLAQGVSGGKYDKDSKQEAVEKARMLPYHMHINLDLLESCHLISAMLLEAANIAAHPYAPKRGNRGVISRYLRRLLDFHDRNVFTGPPETTRDYIVMACKALMKGNWKKCCNYLLDFKCWDLVPNNEKLKSLLKRQVQEQGLKTYLFTYSPHYDAMSLAELSTLFALPSATIHAIVSKMIINNELHASWDQPTGSLKIHDVEPNKLQHLALQLSDKAAYLLENNERLLELKTGGYKYDPKADLDNGRRHKNRRHAYGKRGYRSKFGGKRK